MLLTNAFSLNMLVSLTGRLKFTELTLAEAKVLLAEGFTSCVGHADTANVYTSVLGTPVPMNRATVKLVSGDRMLIGQYQGPRMIEGASLLPEGASIVWVLAEVE